MRIRAILLATYLSLTPLLGSAGAFLQERIPVYDKRYPTFERVLQLMEERNVKTIVETGTAREGAKNCGGDGCSTIIWGQWAKQFNAFVYSVDINRKAIKKSKKACKPYRKNTAIICSDSVAFLQSFGKPIDMLYLDSYDLDHNNPEPSQRHHLKEIMAAYPLLHQESIVMMDDYFENSGGKVRLVMDYLLERGWKIEMFGYQVIFVRE